uniref:Non-structural protein NP-1 n=1 Tax=Rodent bocavirus TaxID=2137546 RepID=A0A2R4LMM7_9VIRU|nr:NP1 protein [Rodent bocavirus]AVW82257.1 NP1 protein [Rodent bocavirus]AVW82277.1 NP1 protein [Rodent bocavirus]
MSGQNTYRKETNYSERTTRRSPLKERKEKHHEKERRRSRSRSPLRKIQNRMEELKKQPFKQKAREDAKQRVSVVDTFVKFKAKHNTEMSFCGFHWHSWRLAKKGTDKVFDDMKAEFQSRCKEGKVEWVDVREMLFRFKKAMDKDYRSMMWHFKFTECEKCDFWDDVYKKHMANVYHEPPQELTDEELLAAVQETELNDQ